MIDDATKRQIEAANPHESTWLSANAGSGKTRVLTDRVARLLLDGVSPQNILCLTYTKAAASEMQNRLFRTLGAWAMKDDASLVAELAELGVTAQGGSDQLARARTLFARAIETPGGLRIQTIHSFCASLLRRFPMESGVSPVFREIEDRAAKLLRQDIVDELADGVHAALVDDIARHYTGEDFARLTGEIVRSKKAFRHVSGNEIWAQHGLTPGYTEHDLLRHVFLGSEAPLIAQLVATLAESAKPTDKKHARILDQLDISAPNLGTLEILVSIFLSGPTAKIPNAAKIGSFPTKDVRLKYPDLIDAVEQLMLRVEAGRNLSNSLYTAQKSLAMHEFATTFIPAYDSRKAQLGWLDFDDLIAKAQDLLTDPLVAQWVLFRLDGGIDHILVDEAQDTSPDQWRIVQLLAQEFGAGYGARGDDSRTIFVVGDIKQSIYSFQGADPREFSAMRQHFSQSLSAANQSLHELSLEHSFRSSPAILNLVDATFSAEHGGQIDASLHRAYHTELPGRVDLWPIVEKAKAPEEMKWFDPTDKLAANDHRIELAEAVAARIKHIVEFESIPDKSGQMVAPTYGDFLILVQRRSALFHEIIRACKALNLPIAGADRLKIGAELAVKDITALLSFLVTPDDDLSLAAVLRSPLIGFSETDLFNLAHYRHEVRLWPALLRQKEKYEGAVKLLSSLRDNADFLGPYETIERILTRHDGRRNLLARLGREAEEGIDAMLNQAVEYERSETPSLTGFLTWLEVDEVEVKRQPDNAGDRIRVMTTHGAKGLESPIVILPDTGDINARQRNELVVIEDQPAIWKPKAELQTDAVRDALAKARQSQAEERERLLYVALTRAEKWLIVCGSGDISATGNSWFRRVEQGMKSANAINFEQPNGVGLRLEHGVWSVALPSAQAEPATAIAGLPDWALQPVRNIPEKPRSIAPSSLEGAKVLQGEIDFEGDDDGGGKQYGLRLHKLLEHLPLYSSETWANIAPQLLGRGVSSEETAGLLAEAAAVLNNPDLKFIFGRDSLAEVDVSASIPDLGDKRLRGTIDRLIVDEHRVLIVDYKSNKITPECAEQTPLGILRQLGAYLEAVEQLYPGRRVDVAILWTRTAKLMPLAHDIVRQALSTTTTP